MANKNSTAVPQKTLLLLQPVKDRISHETIDALERLLQIARRGEITGLAFAAITKTMSHITDVLGTCRTNPSFTRGAVAFLSDEIAGLVHSQDRDSRGGIK